MHMCVSQNNVPGTIVMTIQMSDEDQYKFQITVISTLGTEMAIYQMMYTKRKKSQTHS